jgi:hypothetical protein
MAVAALAGLLDAILGSGSSGNGGSKVGSNASGLGKNILGAPGDPVGTIVDLVQQYQAAAEDKRRFDEQEALKKEALRMQGEQNKVENAQKNRQIGAAGLDWLGQNVARAHKNANLEVFHQGLYSAMLPKGAQQ